MNPPRIHLKPKKEESLKRFHPWIFSGAVARVEGAPAEGEIVDVYTADGRFIARGHCQIGSITVRVLTFEDEPIDRAWWVRRIGEAYRMRVGLGLGENAQTDCYRLVHGEGDGLPGLVVDIYGGTAVVQAHSVGMYDARESVRDALLDVLGDKLTAVYDKSAATLPYNAEVGPVNEHLYGAGAVSGEVTEYGHRFRVNWREGQKTGFFIDQRENRRLLERYARGRTVLNTFCYTGGFSVYALAGGALRVDSVDSSARAVQLAVENVGLNFGPDAPHRGMEADVFEHLKGIGEDYDLIVLDPPAFAKHRQAVGNALQGYKRLNARAISRIRSGGILFTFSCSQAVDKERFRQAVFSAAAMAGRRVRILHQLTQPADHPVNIYHPEGEYLKGLVLYVE